MLFYASSDRQSRLNTRRLLMLGLLLTILALRAGAGQNFFPAGVFHPDDLKVDSFVAKWYGEQLTALEEPSLFEARQDSTVKSYRFLWLRTFNHPVAIRVVIHPDGTGTLITKMADGAGGYKPGNLILNRTESLAREKAEGVLDKIRRVKYWTLPGHDTNSNGRDGAQWIIEGIDHGRYQLVDRWSPKDGPVRELGLYFLRELSHLSFDTRQIY